VLYLVFIWRDRDLASILGHVKFGFCSAPLGALFKEKGDAVLDQAGW